MLQVGSSQVLSLQEAATPPSDGLGVYELLSVLALLRDLNSGHRGPSCSLV